MKYDNNLQVWYEGTEEEESRQDGIILDCNHPDSMKNAAGYCCNANRFLGSSISDVRRLKNEN